MFGPQQLQKLPPQSSSATISVCPIIDTVSCCDIEKDSVKNVTKKRYNFSK